MNGSPPPLLAQDAPAEQVLRSFRLLLTLVRRHFQDLERQTGVGGAQLWALQIIRSRPGIGVSELARMMEVHQSTASNMTKLLVERGLVVAERTGADRRMQALSLLPAAQAVLARAPEPCVGVLPAALEQLEPATLQRLNADLQRILAALPSN